MEQELFESYVPSFLFQSFLL